MESSATGRCIPQKSKKRVFPGSSSCLESKAEDAMITSSTKEHHLVDGARSSKKIKSHKKGKGVTISSTLGGVIDLDSVDCDSLDCASSDFYADVYASEDEYAVLQSQFDNIDLPTGVEASIPPFLDIKMKNKRTSAMQDITSATGFVQSTHPDHARQSLSSMGDPMLEDSGKSQASMNVAGSSSDSGQLDNDDGVLRKYRNFKKFDIVQDHSDHHYATKKSATMQPTRTWAKKIEEDWRILKKDLPDMIFVRVYESRMDLLRAVIIGAEGTPYHDGLFCFDVYFPSNYPHDPPKVYYHSGGLYLNPNLYDNGKVCLSLLNTWPGFNKEKWIPGGSTMLQVLVSIQGLVLNEKPYFNEPMYAELHGTVNGEKKSLLYNERVRIMCLKTMVYAVKKPPKGFEDLVTGHFHDRARGILARCKSYSDGEREVEGFSSGFKRDVGRYMKTLAGALKEIGVTGMEEYLSKGVSESLTQKIKAVFGTQKIRAFFGI